MFTITGCGSCDKYQLCIPWPYDAKFVVQEKAARVSLRADQLLKQLVQPEEKMKEEVGIFYLHFFYFQFFICLYACCYNIIDNSGHD